MKDIHGWEVLHPHHVHHHELRHRVKLFPGASVVGRVSDGQVLGRRCTPCVEHGVGWALGDESGSLRPPWPQGTPWAPGLWVRVEVESQCSQFLSPISPFKLIQDPFLPSLTGLTTNCDPAESVDLLYKSELGIFESASKEFEPTHHLGVSWSNWLN
jgi:hypothetical protein